MDISRLPKQNCTCISIAASAIKRVQQIDPSVTYEQYRGIGGLPKCTDLMDYLTRAVKGYELMQTKRTTAAGYSSTCLSNRSPIM